MPIYLKNTIYTNLVFAHKEIKKPPFSIEKGDSAIRSIYIFHKKTNHNINLE